MSKNNFVPAIIVLAAVCLSCTFLKGRSSSSPYGISDIDKSPVTPVDPNAPFPAMSTDAINALITEIPELGKHRDKVLEAERSAINGLLADIRAKSQAGNVIAHESNIEFTSSSTVTVRADDLSGQIDLIPAAYAAEAPTVPSMGGLEYSLIGRQIAFFKDDAGAVSETDRGQSRTVEMKDDSGTVQATMTKAVDKTNGSVSLELTTSVNMPVFGLNANSRVKLTGDQCPNSEGKVDLTVEYSTNGRAGSSGSTIYDKTITAKIKATVNDDAEIAGMDIDLKQGTRSTAGGRQVYVETSQSGKATSGNSSDLQFDDVRIDRASSQATAADADLSRDGLKAAYLVASAVLNNAKARWQDGGCVKIDAASPGSVEVNSTSQIPVKVVHKVDRADVPSKLEAKLTGGASIDPALIPKTAGMLTYTAPGEAGKSATISLKATSRRGIATIDLTASTGGNSYHIVGGLDDFQTSADVCDIMKPFTLTGGGFTVEFSGGLEGTYSYTGPFNAKGDGTYKVSLPDGPGKPGTMTGGGAGQITGDKVYTGSGVEKYTLTPIEPCR